MPIGRDAEFFQRLFANDAAGGGCGEENGVGDSASERMDGGFPGARPAPTIEVGESVFFR